LKLLDFHLLLHEQLAEVGTLDFLLRQRLLELKNISKKQIAVKKNMHQDYTVTTKVSG
jgi:hypothetical protein